MQAHGLADSKSPGSLVDAALSGNLSGNVKQVAEELLDAGEAAVRKELNTKTTYPRPAEPPRS